MDQSLVSCAPEGVLSGQWDFSLVALSCIVAIAGSFAGLDCADRMRSADTPQSRQRYFVSGALLIGIGVWTMHFIGMLAHDPGFRVQYDPTLSIVSMGAAAFGAGLAFLVINRPVVTWFHVFVGGTAMGLAIASMHYLGMASMRMPAAIDYDPLRFIASIALAITASTGALMLARRPLAGLRVGMSVKLSSAVAMGAAIAGMHYVGMSAARYVPSGGEVAGEGATVGSWSLDDVLVAAGLLIGIALIALASKSSAERQQALESLEKKRDEAIAASRAKDEFLASLSHELRTPLNPALLLASDAASREDFPAAAREAFASIAQHVALEARLIDDLLDLTRISRGMLRLDRRVVDAHQVLEHALGTVRLDAAAKSVALKLELSAAESFVSADPIRLQQVFWNLLQNAVKFTLPNGQITVATRNDTGQLEIQVTDTGIGMSPDEIARSFQSFAQGAHNLGGLGLGLAISRSIVELHGGTITASSSGRGQGSTFIVRLSVVPAPQSAPRTAATLLRAGSVPATSVLLVEDHDSSRQALERLLQRRGHRVLAVRTMGEALAASSQSHFDVLVSDIGLPDGDGYALMRTLRERQSIRGIAVTGYGMEEDVRRAAAAGFEAHVIKPVTVEKLDAALATVVHLQPSEGPSGRHG